MGSVIIQRNILDERTVQKFNHSGSIAEFITQEFPDGWPEGSWTVWMNNEVMDTDDWDYVIGNQTLVILGAPGANPTFWVTIGKAIIAALVSSAISYLLMPKAKNQKRDSSSFYAIASQQNVPRIGDPIPVQYGKVVSYPPVASQPWAYVDNDSGVQYLHQILCLGQGEFEIDSIEIGTTKFVSNPNGVQWWVVPKSLHQGKYGYIENTLGIHEDVVTSFEVSNIQMTRNNLASPHGKMQNPTLGAKTITFKDPISPDILAGSQVLLQGNTFDQLPGSQYPAGTEIQRQSGATNYIQSISADRKTVTFNFNVPINASSGTYAIQMSALALDTPTRGPFAVCLPGKSVNKIQVEITFPQGLVYYDSDGDARVKSCFHTVEIEQIDDYGNKIGNSVFHKVSLQANTNAQIVKTWDFNVSPGRYRVSVLRAQADDNKTSESSASVWTALRGFVVHSVNEEAYGDVTLIAFKMKATSSVALSATDKIKVNCTRKLKTISSNFANIVATVNPVDAFCDMVMANYGARLSTDYLDIDALKIIASKFANTNGFNIIIDYRTTIWEAMQLIGQAYRARPIAVYKKASLRLLRADPNDAAVFSREVFLPDSYSVAYRMGESLESDGYKVYFKDPITWSDRFVTFPTLANIPEEINLEGISSQEHALAHAKTMWESKTKIRKLIEFSTELDAHLVSPGDRISVVSPVVEWTQTARVLRKISATQFQLDTKIKAGNRAVLMRDEYGKPAPMFMLNIASDTDTITIASLPIDVFGPEDGTEATQFMFGNANKVSDSFTVQSVSPSAMTAKVEASEYVESVFTIAPIPGET